MSGDETTEFVQLLIKSHKASLSFQETVATLASSIQKGDVSGKNLEALILQVLYQAAKLQSELAVLIEKSLNACMRQNLN